MTHSPSPADNLWQTKLAARLHDPAEKALVLLRDPEGHENGTSLAAARLLGLNALGPDGAPVGDGTSAHHLFRKSIPQAIYRHVQRADWWAAAADRPQWPMEQITTSAGKTYAYAPWARVQWTSDPQLIHPLSGAVLDMKKHGGLSDTDFKDIRERSFRHVQALLKALGPVDEQPDGWRKALLTLWRFGPELREEADNGKLGELWKLLPADTRIPDHSIWDHLDLVSAFAGAFAADPQGEAALLALSIGPVQSFIAAARKMEDLWASSHLLARLAWQAMRVVCERLGPDAILFPRLRGVPQVDLWLRDECGLPDALFKDCDWQRSKTDGNPLFAAALPNRFVAVVPAAQARDIAQAVQKEVRQWLQELGQKTLRRLLDAAGLKGENLHCHKQMREQLEGFPEVHWATVPFSLIRARNAQKQTDLDVSALAEAMRPFFGAKTGQPCGFLDTPAWQLLQKELQAKDDQGNSFTFFAPNPGALYPAVQDLAERVLAAAKTLRPFQQSTQAGWRCTLTGEAEWLAADAKHLHVPAGQRADTLWTLIAQKRPAWAKKGEHLSALPAIKRLWPTLFAEEVSQALGGKKEVDRFVVSTHTMALAHQLDQWLQKGRLMSVSELDKLNNEIDQFDCKLNRVALPRRLEEVRTNTDSGRRALTIARKLPALLDSADEKPLSEEAETSRCRVRQTLARSREDSHENRQDAALENYYSLLLMDGDRMGAWLSGTDDEYAITYLQSFHTQVREKFKDHAAQNADLKRNGEHKRPLSPGRHLAISGALNDFSLTVVRHVVEEEYLGRLIYAGGDDVFAMLPVADLLPAMQRLRHAYSGHDPAHEGGYGKGKGCLTLQQGFAMLNGRLMRMMGERATASCGAVIAHHQAPLSAVIRELRAAEQRAKNEGGRNAFSITVIKRSGGALRLTAKWGEKGERSEAAGLLQELRRFLAHDDVSRRAAYHTLQWLDERELPKPTGDAAMLQALLARQLAQQAQGAQKAQAPGLAQRLVALTLKEDEDKRIAWLRNFIAVAEFLAREIRFADDLAASGNAPKSDCTEGAAA